MAEFVEFEEYNGGNKVLVNIEHIIKVRPDKNTTYLYFDVATSGNNSTSLSLLHVSENYSVVRRKLQQ